MPLDFETVEVRFTQGLDTRTDVKLVVPGRWLVLNNLTLSSNDALTRRDGMTALVSTAKGNGLALYNAELLVVSGSSVSTVSLAASPATALAVSGPLASVGVSKTEIERASAYVNTPDCAYGAGYVLYAWRSITVPGATGAGVVCTLVDETTGAHVLSEFAVSVAAGASWPRVVFSGGKFFILYILQGGGPDLACRVIDPAAPTVVGNEVLLITNALLTLLPFDACDFGGVGGTASVMVAYWWSAAGSSVRTIQVTATGTVPAIGAGPTNCFTRAQISDLTANAIACVAFGATIGGVFALSSGGALAGLAGTTILNTWAVSIGATQLDATTPAATGALGNLVGVLSDAGNSIVTLFSDQQSSEGVTGVTPVRRLSVNVGLALTAGPTTIINSAAYNAATDAASPKGPYIAGKPFVSGGRTYLPMQVLEHYVIAITTVVNNNQQNTFFLFDMTGTAPFVAGKALYGSLGTNTLPGGTGVAAIGTAPACPSTPNGFRLPCLEMGALSFANGVNVTPTGLCALNLVPNTTKSALRSQLGGATFIANGLLSDYDGLTISGHGFPLFPEGISAVRNAGAGTVTVGVHQVVAIYEWTDGAGQRHQSAPSPAVSWTSSGADTCVVVVPNLMFPGRANVKIALYMTQAGGLTFNRVTTLVTPFANNPAAATTSITIGSATVPAADATIGANELLYSQPNIAGTALPNNAPGPCNVLAVHQNRLWLDLADTPSAFRYSQQMVTGVGLQFNETLGGLVDVSAGNLAGFSELDEKMILFATRKIYAIFGTGPTPSGGYSNYSDPTEIQSDVGCVEPRSILKMPMGVIFKAKKGWHLLGRDLSVRYIGEGVKAYDANDVTATVLLDDRKECRFSSTSGTTLVFSYLTEPGQWSTFAISSDAYAVRDAVWWPTLGAYVHVSLADGLNKDVPGSLTDSPGIRAATQIVTTAKSGFLHLPQLEGFQRVRRFYLTAVPGNSALPVSTSLNVAVDYDDTFAATQPPGSLGAYNFTTVLSQASTQTPVGSTVDLRHRFARQKCKSVAFTFTDTPVGGVAHLVTNGQTFPTTSISALAIQIGVSSDGGATFPVTMSYTAPQEFATLAALVADMAANIPFTGPGILTVTASGTELSINSVATGTATVLRVNTAPFGAGGYAYTFHQLAAGIDGNGLNLTALALEVGTKRGVNRLPAGQTVG